MNKSAGLSSNYANCDNYDVLCDILRDISTDVIKIISDYVNVHTSFRVDHEEKSGKDPEYFNSLTEAWEYMLNTAVMIDKWSCQYSMYPDIYPSVQGADGIIHTDVIKISTPHFPDYVLQDIVDCDTELIESINIVITNFRFSYGIIPTCTPTPLVMECYKGTEMKSTAGWWDDCSPRVFLCEFASKYNLPYWEPIEICIDPTEAKEEAKEDMDPQGIQYNTYSIAVEIESLNHSHNRYFSSPIKAWNYIKACIDTTTHHIGVYWPVHARDITLWTMWYPKNYWVYEQDSGPHWLCEKAYTGIPAWRSIHTKSKRKWDHFEYDKAPTTINTKQFKREFFHHTSPDDTAQSFNHLK